MSDTSPGTVRGFDERYRSVCARDHRFDGQFVMAVMTTGIYCRPSCPARTPKPGNVTFYETSAAAHEAGYRACKRCLPEAVPGSPVWDVRNDTAGRAMRLIAEGVVEREGVAGLAARLGYSSRHLVRVLREHLGASPLALARAQRAQTARLLLVQTDLPVSDVAFAAGFSSTRQFSETMREVFALTATEIRRSYPGRSGHAPGAIELALPYRAPIDSEGVFRWMGDRAVAGAERLGEDGFARTLRTDHGVAWFTVRRTVTDTLILRAKLSHVQDLSLLVERVKRLFDLHADPVAVDRALAQHAELAPCVASLPGIRVPGAADASEMLIRAMVGQQISVASARTILTRLVDELGERVESHFGVDRLFPSMTAIAERGAEVLRGPRARIAAICEAARRIASAELVLSSGDDWRTQREALLALPGVGPWTADYVSMRVTGNPDIMLQGDVAARSGARRLGIPHDPRALEAWAAHLAPWRSYVTAHLWRAAAAPAGHTVTTHHRAEREGTA